MGMYSDSLQCVLNCNTTDVSNLQDNSSVKLFKITDLLGQETIFQKNKILIYIYEDGRVEKVIKLVE